MKSIHPESILALAAASFAITAVSGTLIQRFTAGPPSRQLRLGRCADIRKWPSAPIQVIPIAYGP